MDVLDWNISLHVQIFFVDLGIKKNGFYGFIPLRKRGFIEIHWTILFLFICFSNCCRQRDSALSTRRTETSEQNRRALRNQVVRHTSWESLTSLSEWLPFREGLRRCQNESVLSHILLEIFKRQLVQVLLSFCWRLIGKDWCFVWRKTVGSVRIIVSKSTADVIKCKWQTCSKTLCTVSRYFQKSSVRHEIDAVVHSSYSQNFV